MYFVMSVCQLPCEGIYIIDLADAFIWKKLEGIDIYQCELNPWS